MINHYRPAPVLAIDPNDPFRVVDKSGSTFAVCASKADAADIVRGAAVINAAICLQAIMESSPRLLSKSLHEMGQTHNMSHSRAIC